MFGIGPMELIVVAVVAVVFIGPKRLPEVMKKMGRMFVQLRRQTHEIREGFNDVVRDAERDLELERIKDIKAEVDKLRNINLEEKIKEHVDINPEDLKIEGTAEHKGNDYHDSHYHDGEYVNHDDGFVDVNSLLDKAKEIEDQVLKARKDEFEMPKEGDEEPEESAEQKSPKIDDEKKANPAPSPKEP